MSIPAGELLFWILLAVGIGRIAWRSLRSNPTRRSALAEPASFHARVSVKYRYGAIPGWAQRVKGPMELRIRGPFVELAMARPFPGELLGANRYLHGSETVMAVDGERAPTKGVGWIVLTSKQDKKVVEVAILPHGPLNELLTAIRSAGVRDG